MAEKSAPKFKYKGWKFEDAMMALYANNTCGPDWGVHDDDMKEAVKDYLGDLCDNDLDGNFRIILSRGVGGSYHNKRTPHICHDHVSGKVSPDSRRVRHIYLRMGRCPSFR